MSHLNKISIDEFRETMHTLGAEVSSLTMENEAPDITISHEDVPYLKLPFPYEPKFTLNIETNREGLERLQNALKEVPRSEKSELEHELKTMHEVNECEGRNIKEKAENYIKKKEKAMNNKVEECLKKKSKKKAIPHYQIKYR